MTELDSRFMDPDTYRFALEDDRWRWFLEEHGFAVVRSVLRDGRGYVDEVWSMVERLAEGKLRRGDAKTMARGANWPFMLHGGMIQYLGHTEAQWELRERCAEVFARYFGCSVWQLASSFDGLCLMSGARGYQPRDPLSFVHTDQSPRRNHFWSIQGLINLADCDAGSGGLVVIPGTHRIHHDFLLSKGKCPKGDWYAFSDEEKKDPVFRGYVKVCAEAGDFVLFDSRTFHCNTVPEKVVDRACAYICMLPKDRVPRFIVPRRREALEARRCSSHHPGDGFRMFPEVPRYANAEQRRVILARQAELQRGPSTPLQRSLAYAVA